MEKVNSVTKRARVEDPDWVKSKKEMKETAPAVDKNLSAPVVEENAVDPELDKKVFPISK